jgi:hypothetical protein
VRLRSLLSLRRLGAAPLFIALLSAVLLGGVQEASCEMHGLGAARAGVQMADHAGMARSHESGDVAHDQGTASCDCSCIGACAVSAPLGLPPVAVTLRVALVEPETRWAIGAEPVLSLPRAPDRLLPFANGPPASTSV